MNGYRTMLDTNIVSDLIRHPQGRAAQLLNRIDEVLSAIDVLPFDAPADGYDTIR